VTSGFRVLTRSAFSEAELAALSEAYRLTQRISVIAAQVVTEQLMRDDLDPGQAAALVCKATRLSSMVRRDLVRFLPPETPPQRSDLEAQILADAMAPGVDLAERVRALDSLSGRGAGVQVNVVARRVDLTRLSDADLDELDRIERLALGDGTQPTIVDAYVDPPPHE
jgi:hypothetical protein